MDNSFFFTKQQDLILGRSNIKLFLIYQGNFTFNVNLLCQEKS